MSARADTLARHAWRALPLALFALLLVRTAWMNDDAYITFRTVDNFLNGHGLTWNVHERVQAYTHPLWMFLTSALVFVTAEFYVTSLVFSMLLALAALGHLAFQLARSTAAALAVSALLLSSKAFVEYSTSGLENPLTNLLLVLFIGLFLTKPPERDIQGALDRRLLGLSLLACLAVLNRMDSVLFYAPALAFELWSRRSMRALRTLALGLAPFVAWELFSLAYYGFLFPNTAYAKLNTGIAGVDLARQGGQYLLNALENDSVTLAGIAAGIVAPLALRQPRAWPIVAGIALYLVYIVKVGGDFMMGRFLAAPLCAAAALLFALDWRPRVAWLAGGAAIALGLLVPHPVLTSGADHGAVPDDSSISRNVGDQRRMYYLATGLLNAADHGWEPVHPWVSRGRELAREGSTVVVLGAIGFTGFYAGPQVAIIDFHALSDALLARLPADERHAFVVAHFKRALPRGYEDSVNAKANRIEDPDLAVYYDALCRVTQGPVWSSARWRAIWELNSGALDDRIAAYLARSRPDEAKR